MRPNSVAGADGSPTSATSANPVRPTDNPINGLPISTLYRLYPERSEIRYGLSDRAVDECLLDRARLARGNRLRHRCVGVHSRKVLAAEALPGLPTDELQVPMTLQGISGALSKVTEFAYVDLVFRAQTTDGAAESRVAAMVRLLENSNINMLLGMNIAQLHKVDVDQRRKKLIFVKQGTRKSTFVLGPSSQIDCSGSGYNRGTPGFVELAATSACGLHW